MDVEVDKLPESQVTLRVKLSVAEVENVLHTTYQRLVQRVKIPGFRKGKAPREVVERLVGHEVFLHEATEEAMRWGYRKAVEEAGVVPIDQAEVEPLKGDHDHLTPDQPFEFEAKVAVRPEVALPDYHSLKVEREEREVTDQDVDEVLQNLKERHVTLEPTIHPAGVGDVVTMNINARSVGEEVLNNDDADFELRDEDNAEMDPVLPGLSRELIGVRPGDIREAVLTLPETYGQEELAGKTMSVRALVKEVKRKVFPTLDDEFAQTVSERQTLAELRELVRGNLRQERRMEADEKLASDALEALVSRTFLEVPPALINEETDSMLDDMKRVFGSRGLNFAQYLNVTGKTEDQVRDEMREEAGSNVKRTLVLGALADAENIEVNKEQTDAALDQLIKTTGANERDRRSLASSQRVRANLASRLRRQLALQRLVQLVGDEPDTGEEPDSEPFDGSADLEPASPVADGAP